MKKLPTFYYLDNFIECLKFIEGPCQHLLSAPQKQWLQSFHQLPKSAQCITARLANRKHPLIAKASLDYDEIDAVDEAILELQNLHWLRPLSHSDMHNCLPLMTKSDILSMLRAHNLACTTSASKGRLLEQAKQLLPVEAFVDSSTAQRYLLRNFDETLNFFLFLFFGHTRGRMTQFSMRDLGVMRTRKDSANNQSHFEHADSAQSAFYYAQWRDQVRGTSFDEYARIEPNLLPEAKGTLAQRYKDEVLWLLGKAWLQQDKHYAMTLLSASNQDAAQEKWIRETYRLGDKDLARQKLECILEDPASDELLLFAKDFLAQKFKQKKTSRLTDLLKQSQSVVAIDEIYINSVERGVVEHYKREGLIAARTENRMWLTLFGLCFWDIIYSTDAQALNNEFDIRPNVLLENRLYSDHGEAIDGLLAHCLDKHNFIRHLTETSAKHYGKVNALFQWHPRLLDNIKLLLQYAQPQQYLDMLKAMAVDYKSLSDGFPDIMVVERDQLRLEEIKAPGDALRRNQLVSINKLSDCGFDVRITKVNWCRDPMQPYVVVDIETTGGQSRYHRITEIGAVKRINGITVARWQSLINPQRKIPSNITALTGIDDEMVVDAPTFADIAESFEAFTQGCIFVAHNVNFDYGFIKQEYERLGQSYRRPKFCTCAEMRKVKRGLKSYSLANLTAYFDIPMKRHHRAMSDAEAAAELLSIIHQLKDEAGVD
ncbi:exonuclease domain-containing protein [Alteromonas facilis]|uniref:exonuclease domain-containing protein n=1 Tax=Alteromonas facilis TaxID=2048004 RepID=UPI000C290641|nr:exonuclease domain-containing protein [Alteromonas facilis]